MCVHMSVHMPVLVSIHFYVHMSLMSPLCGCSQAVSDGSKECWHQVVLALTSRIVSSNSGCAAVAACAAACAAVAAALAAYL